MREATIPLAVIRVVQVDGLPGEHRLATAAAGGTEGEGEETQAQLVMAAAVPRHAEILRRCVQKWKRPAGERH